MITLTLNNGKTFEVQDTSLTEGVISIFSNIDVISDALESITTETLKNAYLGETILTNKVLEGGFFAPADEYGMFSMTFNIREKTGEEIINERLDEQDAALMELAEMIGG